MVSSFDREASAFHASCEIASLRSQLSEIYLDLGENGIDVTREWADATNALLTLIKRIEQLKVED